MNKKNLTALIILVVLIVIYMLTKLNNKTEKLISFFDVDSSKVAAIEISTAEDTLKLVKTDGKWMIDYPVKYEPEKRKIDDIFGKVLKAKTSKIPISESKNSFETYNVTDSLGTKITFFDKNGKILSSAIVGKSSNYNSSPVRRPDENKIYLLKTNITYTIKPRLDSWRNRYIVNFDKENLSKIFVSYDDNNYTLTATDTLWQYDDEKESFPIKEKNRALKNILSSASKVRVTKFIDNDFEKYAKDFENPILELTIEDFDNNSWHLKFIKGEDNKVIIQKNDETEHLYMVYENWIKKFQKKAEDFQKEK
ncbi:MAG: hypothetical protein B6D62_02660 [Candidatus Cloacimonas sp. 4484_275]|nr:MAG: hypothetical protein B6D62_02660 [Candidatus Cloacimonas sp. 4484_275]